MEAAHLLSKHMEAAHGLSARMKTALGFSANTEAALKEAIQCSRKFSEYPQSVNGQKPSGFLPSARVQKTEP
jgi:hypothetical protein